MTTILRTSNKPHVYRNGARFVAGETWSPGKHQFPRKALKHPATKMKNSAVVTGEGAPAAPAPASARRPKPLDTQGFTDPRIIEMLGFELSQEGMAERFIAEHGTSARYCHDWKDWLVWTGQRWQIDRKKSITRLSSQTIRKLKKRSQVAL
jgi:hypothetical protein